jgi:hypothetical protein
MPLCGVGTTCFPLLITPAMLTAVLKIQQIILLPAACLTSTILAVVDGSAMCQNMGWMGYALKNTLAGSHGIHGKTGRFYSKPKPRS